MTITAQTRQLAAEARALALVENTRRTTRPGSESTTLKPGDEVRIVRPRGKYRAREGTVVSINRDKFPFGRGTYVEIGVHFGDVKPEHLTAAEAHAWFRADELHEAAVRAIPQRRSRRRAATG